MSEYQYCPPERFEKNSRILEWWTSKHDRALSEHIAECHWLWGWDMPEKIERITDNSLFENWKQKDPLCSGRSWQSVLSRFLQARAKQQGYINLIRPPTIQRCGLCNKEFLENSVPSSIARHFGINQIDICFECIQKAHNPHRDTATKEEVVQFIQDLAKAVQAVPSQNLGVIWETYRYLTTKERASVLTLNYRRPSISRIKDLFGSWLNALVEAGILEDGVRVTTRGTQCVAKDSHACLSLGEKTIDDFLFNRGVSHTREPRYPDSNYRGDFLVKDIFIEYFGLAGNPEYDAKIEEKKRICLRYDIPLIAIYPRDLVSESRLGSKLSDVLR